MNVNKLRGKIVEKGMNVDEVADKIGTSRASLYRKLAEFEKLTIGEASRLQIVLELTSEESCEIFLI